MTEFAQVGASAVALLVVEAEPLPQLEVVFDDVVEASLDAPQLEVVVGVVVEVGAQADSLDAPQLEVVVDAVVEAGAQVDSLDAPQLVVVVSEDPVTGVEDGQVDPVAFPQLEVVLADPELVVSLVPQEAVEPLQEVLAVESWMAGAVSVLQLEVVFVFHPKLEESAEVSQESPLLGAIKGTSTTLRVCFLYLCPFKLKE